MATDYYVLVCSKFVLIEFYWNVGCNNKREWGDQYHRGVEGEVSDCKMFFLKTVFVGSLYPLE